MINLHLGRTQGKDALKERSYTNTSVVQDKPADKPLDIAQIGIGAGVGGLLGAGIGAGVQALRAHSAVNSVPVQHVTETWQVPVTTNQELGKIPHEQYTPASHWFNDTTSCSPNPWNRPTVVINNDATVPVVRAVPTLDGNGQPVMTTVTKEFSGHGTPNVSWQNKDINVPTLKGYTTRSNDDTHYETHYPTTTDSNGQTHTSSCSVSILDGIRTTFDPTIQNRTVGNYKAPAVEFDSGVHTGAMVLKGMGVGFVGGAILGGAAMVAKQELQKRHQS